ncbi:MAG: hypothetical protein GY696_08005, partial [Gammaproteobacteria bacterium]|nr:hypothetical protein [Gammaproteobacteria bacterium]
MFNKIKKTFMQAITIKTSNHSNLSGSKNHVARLLMLLAMFLFTNQTALAVCGITSNTEATLNAQVWWGGASSGLDYFLDFTGGGDPVASAATTGATGQEGIAVHTKQDGTLLLFTDGIGIWDGQTETLLQTGIGGSNSTSQAAAITPIPGGDPDNDFYVFWNDNSHTSPFGYVTVDLAAGAVTNNETLETAVGESLTAIPHANGTDFWVLVRTQSPSVVKVYLVNSGGVTLDSTQAVLSSTYSFDSTLVFSPVNDKLILTGSSSAGLSVADFDPATGIISNEQLRLTSLGGYTPSFSPSGDRIFMTSNGGRNGVPQYHDLSGAVDNRTTVPGASGTYGASRLGPNGKIYYSDANAQSFGVVSDPDGSPTFSTISLNGGTSGNGVPNPNFAACEVIVVQDRDYDDALASYGEAAHSVIDDTLYIGATAPDGEEIGFDTPNSDGDDNDGTDDEDNITLANYSEGMSCTGTGGTYTTASGEYCVVVSATNTTGADAQLVGWLDYDGNGTFEATERSIVSPAGTNPTAVDDGTFTTGNLPTGGAQDVILVFGFELKTDESPITVLRTRLSPNLITTDPGSDGTLAGGEVEDQQVPAGILPTLADDYDDAPASYGEAAHSGIGSTLYIGATAPDAETAGFDTPNSDGDDNDGTDDEDAITLATYSEGMSCTGGSGTYTTASGEYCITVSATNTTGSNAQLVGWLDYDGNGTFEATERSIVSPAGTNPTA